MSRRNKRSAQQYNINVLPKVIKNISWKAIFTVFISIFALMKTLMPTNEMNKIRAFLNTPCPVTSSPWKIILICTAVVFFLIFVLRPLNMFRYETAEYVLKLVGNTLIVPFAFILMMYVAPLLFPGYYAEQNWTVGRSMLSVFILCLLITLGEVVYNAFAYGAQLSAGNILFCVFCTLLFAPIPIFIGYVWTHNVQLKRNLAEANELNRRLMELRTEQSTVGTRAADTIEGKETLTLANGVRETFTLNTENVLYGEAEGNYIRLHFMTESGGSPASKMLRTTMKQAEEAFARCHFISRCHRAFFVNIKQVRGVEGNAQGYRLHIEGCSETVPVSRAYVKAVRTMIEHRM